MRRRKTGRFIALDADALSAAEVAQSYGRYGVETITSSFRTLLSGTAKVGEFDLAYSTGLFDYLNQKTCARARRLARVLLPDAPVPAAR